MEEDEIYVSKVTIVSSERLDIKKLADKVSAFGTVTSVSSERSDEGDEEEED
jgi:hypothetical protein